MASVLKQSVINDVGIQIKSQTSVPMIDMQKITIILILASNMAFAQNDLLRNANTNYNTLKFYSLAIPDFVKYLSQNPQDAKSRLSLADCYFLTNELDKAEEEYRQAFKSNIQVEGRHILNYGNILRSQGKFDEAKAIYATYPSNDNNASKNFSNSVDFARKQMGEKPQYKVTIESAASTDGSDFAPAFYKDNIVFATSKIAGKTSGEANELYIGTVSANGAISEVEPMRSRLRVYNDAPVSFSKDGSFVFFTENNFRDGVRQIAGTDMHLSLFSTQVKSKENWLEEQSFSYNSMDYSVGQPYLSPDGTKLYFSSDKPGGMGGFDLYVCELVNGKWNNPQNLGAIVNTPGNEMTPFVLGSKLFFSSDWHPGFGGLDIFQVEIVGKNFKSVKNLGLPVNSPYDDYYFILSSDEKTGYLTSNRKGGEGLEDIYRATYLGAPSTPATPTASVPATPTKPETPKASTPPTAKAPEKVTEYEIPKPKKTKTFVGRVKDKQTGEDVEKLVVIAERSTTKEKIQADYNSKGEYFLDLEPNVTYKVMYSAPGYQVVYHDVLPMEGQSELPVFEIRKSFASSPLSDDEVAQSKPKTPKEQPKPKTIETSEVYLVSLGVMSKMDPKQYEELKKIGNVIIADDADKKLYQLGYFEDKKYATEVLSLMKKDFKSAGLKTISVGGFNEMERMIIASSLVDPKPLPAAAKPSTPRELPPDLVAKGGAPVKPAEKTATPASKPAEKTAVTSGAPAATTTANPGEKPASTPKPAGKPVATPTKPPLPKPKVALPSGDAIVKGGTKAEEKPAISVKPPVTTKPATTSPKPSIGKTPASQPKPTIEPKPVPAPSGYVYRVQLGAFKSLTTNAFPELASLGKVSSNKEKEVFFYYLGDFKNETLARDAQAKAEKKLGKKLFVVAFKNGVKVNLSEVK